MDAKEIGRELRATVERLGKQHNMGVENWKVDRSTGFLSFTFDHDATSVFDPEDRAGHQRDLKAFLTALRTEVERLDPSVRSDQWRGVHPVQCMRPGYDRIWIRLPGLAQEDLGAPTMGDVFEAIEEGVVGDVIDWVKRKLKGKKRTVSKKVGPDKWEFQGKTGHWRTVNGHEIFFPDDRGAPMGMPKAMQRKGKR